MGHTPGPSDERSWGEAVPGVKGPDVYDCGCYLNCPLHKAAPELLAALGAVEWVPFEDREWSVTDYHCPSCGGTEPGTASDDPGGHKPDCQLANALAKAKQ